MRFFPRSASRLNAKGCDNAGNPLPPAIPAIELKDKDGRVYAEIGSMEPAIQAELDRILKNIPVSGMREVEEPD